MTNNSNILDEQLVPFDTNGGDRKEFYEYVLNQINENKVGFNKSSRKIVILLFDNSYHEYNELIEQYTEITSQGRCKFDIHKEFEKLKENNILLYGITVNPIDKAKIFASEISDLFNTPILDFSKDTNCIANLITGIILKNVEEKQFNTYVEKQTETVKTLLKTL